MSIKNSIIIKLYNILIFFKLIMDFKTLKNNLIFGNKHQISNRALAQCEALYEKIKKEFEIEPYRLLFQDSCLQMKYINNENSNVLYLEFSNNIIEAFVAGKTGLFSYREITDDECLAKSIIAYAS